MELIFIKHFIPLRIDCFFFRLSAVEKITLLNNGKLRVVIPLRELKVKFTDFALILNRFRTIQNRCLLQINIDFKEISVNRPIEKCEMTYKK